MKPLAAGIRTESLPDSGRALRGTSTGPASPALTTANDWSEPGMAQTVLDALPDAVLVVDGNGRIAAVNEAAERLFQYRRDEIAGLHVSTVLPLEQAGAADFCSAQCPDSWRCELKMNMRSVLGRRKDGKDFAAELYLSAAAAAQALTVAVIRETAVRQAEGVDMLHAMMHEPATSFTDLQHGVCQRLVGVSLLATGYANAAARRADGQAQTYARISNEVDNAVAELRRVMNDMAPPAFDLRNLNDAVACLIEKLASHSHANFRYHGPERLRLHSAAVASQFLMILQEAARNAATHAGASHIDVSIEQGADWVLLRVLDDGSGIVPVETTEDSGVGIQLMRDRARLIGAQFDVSSRHGGGTTVSCLLPVPIFVDAAPR